MKRFIVYCLVAVLACLPATAKAWKMAVMSDIHVMAPELLHEDGQAFQDYISNDRKMLRESPALLQTAVKAILAEQPDVVLVTGDLTKDGEKVSHELVAQMLKPLRDKGIPVYVIPGNHDVNNPHAVAFEGAKTERVATLSADEFAQNYADYGYGSAIARDTNSLSYVVQLNDNTRLLAIDACKYEENDYDLNTCVTGGRIKDATMEFIRKQVADANAHGCKMLTMMHHGLVQHWTWQDRVMAEYLVDDWKKQSKAFSKLGLNIVFTGHFHAQDIAARGKGDNAVYDIETGSLVSYPMPYRLINFEGNNIKITTRHIDSIPGFTPSTTLADYAQSFAEKGISSIISNMLPKKVPADIATKASKALAKAYVAHLAGDEKMPEGYSDELNAACKQLRHYSWKYAFALKKLGGYMFDDIAPADNNLTIVTGNQY